MDHRAEPRAEPRGFDLPHCLSRLPLFADLSPPELERLAQGCLLRRYGRGEDIFRVGEPCEAFHVTVSGQVKLYGISPMGQEKVIELIGPGGSFAEALMFTDRPYIINAQSLTDTLLLSVRKQAVVAEIERDPRVAMRMLAGLSRRLHGLVHDVQAYALHSGVQRVIGYLLREAGEADSLLADAGGSRPMPCTPSAAGGAAAQADEPPVTVSLPVSKAVIASRLSLTPEYFSRVLGELEGAGLIEVDRRDIRILNLTRLAGHLRA